MKEIREQSEEKKQDRTNPTAMGFVQHAFARGVVEQIEKKIYEEGTWMNKRNREKAAKRWEMRKWLLVRYCIFDDATYKDISLYADTSEKNAGTLCRSTINLLWDESPMDLKVKFPKEEILFIKSGRSEDGKERLSRGLKGLRHRPESVQKIKDARQRNKLKKANND
jgi:hypothetical protein